MNRLQPSQYGLALHTSSPDLGLALSNFAGDCRSQTWPLGRDLSSHLHDLLTQFLPPQTWHDLAFVAVARGPGSFTGTRIGVVTARTLAQQLEIPVYAISSLAAIAHHEATQQSISPTGDIAVELAAQRGQLHTAIFHGVQGNDGAIALQVEQPDQIMTPDAWHQHLAARPHPYQLLRAEDGLGATTPSILALAYHDWQQGVRPHWSEAVPYYGQHPVQMG